MEKYLTPKQVSEILQVSERTLYRWIRRGWIKAIILPGNRIRIPQSEILRLTNNTKTLVEAEA
jgi:excisionase family DNA binding protein